MGGGVRFDDLPAVFPAEHIAFEDPALGQIDALAPIGKGSRVMIVGGTRSGKTEVLRRLAATLSARDGLQTFVVLVGVRPEEVGEWPEPAQAVTLAASPDSQSQAVAAAIDQARRIVGRGGDVVVLLDTLDGVPDHAARRALASARNIPDGGSLTVIATALEPFGGETTVVALDAARASLGAFPAIDAVSSGTLRPELLVGEERAGEILRARQDAAAQ
jgi:transcription termination factor Rho